MNDIKALVKTPYLVTDRVAEVFGNQAEGYLKETGHRAAGQTHSKEDQYPYECDEQRAKAGKNDGENGKAVDERRK